MKKRVLLSGIVASLLLVGCGSGSSGDSDTVVNAATAKIVGSYESLTSTTTTTNKLLLQADSVSVENSDVTLEVYDLGKNGELIKDENASCEITGPNSYECSVEPNGSYVVRVVQKLENGKVAVLNTTAVVKEGTSEADVTKETTLVTQVVTQKVKESLESLKDYGITDDVIQDIIEKIIPVVQQTIEEKVKSGEIVITDADFIVPDENATLPTTTVTDAAIISSEIDDNVSAINTEIVQQQVDENPEVEDNARLVAIEDYLKFLMGQDNSTNKEFIDELADFLNEVNDKIDINESQISDYITVDQSQIDEVKNMISDLQNKVNTDLPSVVSQYPFFENPIYIDALNDFNVSDFKIEGTIQLLLLDGLVQNSEFTVSVFKKILDENPSIADKYKKPVIVFTDNYDSLYFGVSSVYNVFEENSSVDVPEIQSATITYKDNEGNEKTAQIEVSHDGTYEGFEQYSADLSDITDIQPYATVTLEAKFTDNNVSTAQFAYVPSNVDTSSETIDFDITSASTVYSDKNETDYILTWTDIFSLNGLSVGYKFEQELPADVNTSELTYCDYVMNNTCYIDNMYGSGLKIKIFNGENNITLTPQLIDENGNIVGKLDSVSKTIELKNTADVAGSTTVQVSGSVNTSHPDEYKVALIRDEGNCDDNGCTDTYTIVTETNISNDGTYTLDVNLSDIISYTTDSQYIAYIVGVLPKDTDTINEPWDFYWPDDLIFISKDYYTDTFIVEKYLNDGTYESEPIYEATNFSGINFTLYDDYEYTDDETYSDDANYTEDENYTEPTYIDESNLSAYLIDKPQSFELDDVANKTFSIITKEPISIEFDENGVANITLSEFNQTYTAKYENGYVNLYNGDKTVAQFEKVKEDDNGIIALGTSTYEYTYTDPETNETVTVNERYQYLDAWVANIDPVDMGSISLPFTYYDEYGNTWTFNDDGTVMTPWGSEGNYTIEDGKIVMTDSYEDDDSGFKEITAIQIVSKIDRYYVIMNESNWTDWRTSDEYKDKTFNDLIDSNISVFGYYLNSDGTVTDEYSPEDVNATYELISDKEVKLNICYSDETCWSIDIKIDPETGTVYEEDYSVWPEIVSDSPIVELPASKKTPTNFKDYIKNVRESIAKKAF